MLQNLTRTIIDCDKYYQYNKKLLFDKQQEEILSELNEVEQDLNTAIK